MVAMRPSVDASYKFNWDFIKENGFESFRIKVTDELASFLGVFRIHVSGDFYSTKYIEAWVNIIRANTQIQFWAYTRSWKLTELLKSLHELAALPNMNLWASVDKDTGDSSETVSWPRAYLSINDNDIPEYPVEMVFRNNGSKKWKNPVIKLGGNQVCPLETGRKYGGRVTCASCRLCVDKITAAKIPEMV